MPAMKAALMSELVVWTCVGSPPCAARSAANRATMLASRPSVANTHPPGVQVGEHADVVLAFDCGGLIHPDPAHPRACQEVCVSWFVRFSVEVGVEAVGELEGQGAEGGFPALDGGAFHEPAGGVALGLGDALLFGAFAGAFVFDVADGQPEEFDGGGVVGEVSAVFGDLAELVVGRLDRVGGVDDLADFGWEARNGMNRSHACSQVATVAG